MNVRHCCFLLIGLLGCGDAPPTRVSSEVGSSKIKVEKVGEDDGAQSSADAKADGSQSDSKNAQDQAGSSRQATRDEMADEEDSDTDDELRTVVVYVEAKSSQSEQASNQRHEDGTQQGEDGARNGSDSSSDQGDQHGGGQNTDRSEEEKPKPEPKPTPTQPGDSSPNSVRYLAPPDHDYAKDYNDQDAAPKRHLALWGESPSSEITLSFGLESFNKSETYRILVSSTPHFGEDPDKNYEIKVEAKETGLADTCNDKKQNNLRATVTGLKPNTTYFYIAMAGNQRSKEMHFVTAPSSHSVPFKIMSGGDSRSDRDMRREMNRVMSDLLERDPSYLALIHGGDFVDDGSKCKLWIKWLDDHAETLTSNGRILPLLPTFGNHETGGEEEFARVFFDPRGQGKFYYASSIGRLRLLVLNSEISVDGDQKGWIEAQLAKFKSEGQLMVIPGYHKPAWPAHKDPGPTTTWIKLWEDYQVSLVLESDGHTLKQTCPIFDNKCDAKRGIVYVGEGGLGVEQRSAEQSDAWYFEQGGYAMGQHHVQSIEVSPAKGFYQVFYDGKFHHGIDLR